MTNKIVYKSSCISYDKGFVYTASYNPLYYEAALHSARTLKDFYPSANITLFTHEEWVDNRVEEVFSEVRTGIQHFKRARLICNKNTPYNYTVANDCDSIISHRDIKYIFDLLQNNDILFGVNHAYTVANDKLMYVDKERKCFPNLHGSLCVYQKNNLTQNFFQAWYDEYIKNVFNDWKYDWAYSIWKNFDMFALWCIQNNLQGRFDKLQDLKIGNLPDRWNTTIQDLKKNMSGRPVVQQYPSSILNDRQNLYFYKDIIKNIKKYPKDKKVENIDKFS